MTATTPAALFEPSVMVPLQNIELIPGSPLVIRNVAWEQFELILGSLEEQHVCRRVFPALPILQLIPQWVKRGLTEGAGKVLREFRRQDWNEQVNN
jgi:hypothetical protein